MNASATLEQLVADSSWLRRLAVALVKDEAAADDLVQDTYAIAATRTRHRFRTTVVLQRVSTAVIRVVDAETGVPVSNAKISTGWFSDDGVSAVTGSDGIARVNVLLPANITVEAEDYAYAREVLHDPKHADGPSGLKSRALVLFAGNRDFHGPAQVRLDVPLKRGIAVRGKVMRADGSVVAEASVVLSGPAGGEKLVDVPAKTDASGTFQTSVPVPGRYGLSAERGDLTNDGAIAVEVPVEGRTDLVARVVARGEIRGVVVDLGAKPVAGARVSLPGTTLAPTVTDANGRFVVENVVGAVVLVAHRGSESSAIHRAQVKSGERAEVILQIGPTGISGIAIDHDGTPVAGAEVWLNPCCGGNPPIVSGKRVITDPSGAFSFDTPRGELVLSVRRSEDDDFEDEDDLEVQGGSHGIRLRVP